MSDYVGLRAVVSHALGVGGSLIITRRGQEFSAEIGVSQAQSMSLEEAITVVCLSHIKWGGKNE